MLFYVETMSSSSSPSAHKISHYDELSMEQSLRFSDSLKDLKNLRTQLYSAAEYFELSYANDDHKHIVVDTLKDYVIKAVISTVDHLGSVTYKVNALVDEKVEGISCTELQVSRIQQRLQTCKGFVDRQGLCQQSLEMTIPRYHKRYLLPVGQRVYGSSRHLSKHQFSSLDDEDDWHQFRNAVRSSIRDTPSSSGRKGYSPSPSLRPSLRSGTFSFTEKETLSDKRSPSPHRAKFPLLRSGSLSSRSTTPLTRATTPQSSRPTTPLSNRPTTPNSSDTRWQHPSEPQKSASMRFHVEKSSSREIEQYPSKSKRLLKALLSRRKSKKDDSLYTFLDEY